MISQQSPSKFDFTFAQRVINISFLVIMVGVLTSFVYKSSDKVDGIQGESKVTTSAPYIGQIAIFPYSFAPRNWLPCEGQLLSIPQNTALFSLIGTTYGGNGQTTFGLPDLRGRVIVSKGNGPSTPNYSLGQTGGTTNTTLTTSNMPSHSHTAIGTMNYPASDGGGDDTDPSGKYLGASENDLYSSTSNTTLGPVNVNITVSNQGSGTSFTNMPPYQTLGYYISTVGVYPSP